MTGGHSKPAPDLHFGVRRGYIKGMGTRPLLAGPGVVLALLAGVLGCTDRPRLSPSAGPGDGQGPVSTITSPAEYDTVQVSPPGFSVAFHVDDPDGVDSIWIWLEPNINTLVQYDGGGQPNVSIGTSSIYILNDSALHGDTLNVMVRARDVLGDTGAVAVRHLLIQ